MHEWLLKIRRALPKVTTGIAEGIGNAIGAGIVTLVVSLFAGIGYWWSQGSDSPEVTDLLTRGDAYLDTGRYDLALKTYEAALKLAPNNAAASFGQQKARLFAGMGPGFDAEAARTALRAMAENHPKDAHLRVMLGRLAAAGRDSERARSHYEGALALDPELAQAWFALGILDQEAGRLEEARKRYERAVELAPDHRQYVTNLTGLFLDQGDYQATLTRYEGLLAVAPRLLLARLDAGNAARLAGELDRAAWHHERLAQDLSRSGVFQQGDNAAQWVFDLPQGSVTMDAPDTKRLYALLAIALTRWLNGDQTGARHAADTAKALPELSRGLAVIEQDLRRLETVRPEWKERIAAYREMLGLPVP